jgi:hypothetical protein
MLNMMESKDVYSISSCYLYDKLMEMEGKVTDKESENDLT